MAFRGSIGATQNTNSTTCVITVNTLGIQLGDVVVLSGQGGSTGATFSSPGFGVVGALTNVNMTSSGETAMAPLFKVATGSEPTTYTVTCSSSNLWALQCNVFSGRSGVITAAGQVTGAITVQPWSLAIATITAANGDDLVFLCSDGGNKGSNNSTLNAPTGPGTFGNILDTNGTAASFFTSCHSANLLNYGGGATGTTTGTISSPTGATNDSVGYLIALAAQPSGGGGAVVWGLT